MKTSNKFSIISKEDLIKIANSKIEQINRKYSDCSFLEKVKLEINYNNETSPEKSILLNEEEMKELKKLAKTDKNLTQAELCNIVIDKYVAGDSSLKRASENVQKAVLYSQPKYTSCPRNCYSDFNYPPVVRWLYISNPDQLIKNYNNGDIYKYPFLQSCSKDYYYAENQYNDNEWSSNVKFIIHPKSETSKAVDIGRRKYGNNEVIYPPNQEFVILDKQLVRYTTPKSDFYRWVIHMQEK